MDGSGAIHVDRQGIVDRCVMYPGSYSNDTEKKQENVEVVVELINGKLNAKHSWQSDSSFSRVPELLFKDRPEAYKPRLVSIGPFHHGQQHLQPMEARKIEYLDNFLGRNSSVKLGNYVEAVTDLVERAYQCYPEMQVERNGVTPRAGPYIGLVMMMVVDGCFILELLLKFKEEKLLNDEQMMKSISVFAFVDLILLENQLPFFVLEELYRVFNFNRAPKDSCPLKNLICSTLVFSIMRLLFGKFHSKYQQKQLSEGDGKARHLLDFLRQFLIPSSPLPFRLLQELRNEELEKERRIYDEMKEPKAVGGAPKRLLDGASSCVRLLCNVEEDYPQVDPREEWNNVAAEPILCATELENSNVKFVINKDSTCFSNINFDNSNGVLTIPGIVVYGFTTEIILRNLLAYEMYTYDYSYITEYIVFLKNLIHSGKDVELLRDKGILKATLHDPEDMAKLFHNLPNCVPKYSHFTRPICHELLKYSNKRLHKWKASLILNYFNTPWALISVVAAIVLLFLTVMQAIYAALSYHY